MSKERPWGNGTPKWTRDATANDSDKSFTVPAGKVWDMRGMLMTLVTTATVGNRAMRISIAPDGTNYEIFGSVANVAASLTKYYQFSFAGVSDDWQANYFTEVFSMMPMILPAGAVIRIYDVAAIDAAADDLTVVLHYVEYDA